MINGLHIAIPTPGEIRIETAMSVGAVVSDLARQKIRHTMSYFSSADIVYSRNRLAARFMADKNYSHMLFVDGDMGFAVKELKAMLEMNAPFVACDYPMREMDVEAFRKAVEADAELPADQRSTTAQLLSRQSSFTFRRHGFDGKPWPFAVNGPFVSVPAVGLGLALIRREVFETMIEKGCVDPITPEPPNYPERSSFGYFDRVRDVSGKWMSEDISFCRRWIEDCGGRIWVRQDAPMTHIGAFRFEGRLQDYLESQIRPGQAGPNGAG